MATSTIALIFFVALAALSFEQAESGQVYDSVPLAKRFGLDLASELQGGGERRTFAGLYLPMPSFLRHPRYTQPHLPSMKDWKAFDSKEIKRSDQDRLNLHWMRQDRFSSASSSRPRGRVVMHVERQKFGRNRPYH
uniref:Uncharacterized protein n=1 Tax=Plectus sambesii TaxID=2011161 RepID=A0A914W6M8_9BILA